MRFALLRSVLPAAAFTALAERIDRWWDDFFALWGLFDPMQRKAYVDSMKAESLDADMIDHGWHGGFAAGSGGDEG